MANYNSVDEMILSEKNLVKLVDNTAHDDNVLTFTGCDFFKFKGHTAQNIYVSGNSFIGFNENAEHLLVGRRDTKLWNFYKEEGKLYDYYKFLRMRWDGYATYSSTDIQYKLTYDVFLFSTGSIYIRVLNAPKNASYLGTSRLNKENGSLDFNLVAGEEKELYFTALDENGTDFSMHDGRISILPPFDRKFLIEDDGKFYKEVGGTLVEIKGISIPDSSAFKTHGFDDALSGSLLLGLKKPKIHYFQDSDLELADISLKIKAKAFNQIIYTENVDMTDSSILGIEKIRVDSDGEILFAISLDKGASYLSFVNEKWGVLTDEKSGMTKEALFEIGVDKWAMVANTGMYKIRAYLKDTAILRKITIDYVNGGM